MSTTLQFSSWQSLFIHTLTLRHTHSYTYTDKHTITHSQMIKSLNKHFYRLVSGRKEKSELPFCGQHCCVSRAVAVTVRSARSEFQCQSQCSASKCQSCRQYIISNRCTCSCVCVCERNNFQFLFDFYLYTKSKRNGKIEKPAATVRAASACEMKMSWPVATASTEAAATQATTMENRLYHIQVLELVPVSVAALHLSGRS